LACNIIENWTERGPVRNDKVALGSSARGMIRGETSLAGIGSSSEVM